LKPTVITLVYGLGFAVVLVLLIVPALMAAQQDVAKMLRSYRRAVRAPALRAFFAVTSAIVMGWGVLTLGWYLATGASNPILSAVAPFTSVDSFAKAMALFSAGAAIVAVVAYGVGIARFMKRQRDDQPAEQP